MRESTSRAYDSALHCFNNFCTGLLHISSPLPSSAALVAAYLAYCVNTRGFAVSTIDGRVAALQHWHRLASDRERLAGRPALPSPVDDPMVGRLLRSIRRRHGRPAKGRLALSKAEFRAVYAGGFNLATPQGLHNRLALMLLNLGCLRRRAASYLRVAYRVVDGRVCFLAGSDVWVGWDPDVGLRFVGLRVLADKNVREGDDDVRAYIPERVPGLGILPVDVLLHYIVTVAPPSGGFLLAAPLGAALPATGFRSNPYTAFSSAFQRAYRRALPGCAPALLARVGSHSGRKSLAQWLWEAYGSVRLVADVGHWRHSGEALNIYFVSPRRVILQCLARL